MQDIILTDARKASLDALVAAASVWDPATTTIDLLTDAIGSVGPKTDPADLVAAIPTATQFPGYAQFAMTTWGGDYDDGNSNWFVNDVIHQFITNAVNTDPCTIIGYFYTNGTNVRVILFDTPVVINQAFQAVTVTPFFAYGQ